MTTPATYLETCAAYYAALEALRPIAIAVRTHPAATRLTALPDEVLRLILSHFIKDAKFLVSLSRVNKQFRDLLTSTEMLKEMIKKTASWESAFGPGSSGSQEKAEKLLARPDLTKVLQLALQAKLSSAIRGLFIGLDASGKTSILYKLKLGEVVTTIPTIGFNVENVQYRNVEFTLWDVGGNERIRPLFRHYYQNTQLVIWVIDSNDRERFDEMQRWFAEVMREEELRNSILLILANKQDLPGCLPISEIVERLHLHTLADRKWYIQACCAHTGDGLYEGLDWAVKACDTVF
eukprot:gnl/Spiro4/18377_TR9836_c0_g1_i1.p1 gnl/Spiro4/18377_TR9836_c0_g1~~gnl/Spiro4/18377_TR9836_c0_g1_i1.p1  ORF type:complete len:293 (-),score=51.99 gnl/Spiro4/18377_TR9836_c0_g1_i1:128-1006(-)